jgi:3-hydroxy-9,10-secoandrosta-1,3,5(10)-triene-9,17-dione monooxygenase
MLYGVCDLATAILKSGRLPTDEERTQFRSEAAFSGRQLVQAVNLVWDAGGGGVIYDGNPLSRAFRDISTAARHLTQNWDINAGAHGRVVLGLPVDNPSL